MYVLQSSDALQLRIKLDNANGYIIERRTYVFSTHFDLRLLHIFHRKKNSNKIYGEKFSTCVMPDSLLQWVFRNIAYRRWTNYYFKIATLYFDVFFCGEKFFCDEHKHFCRLYLLRRFSVPTNRLASRSRTWKV